MVQSKKKPDGPAEPKQKRGRGRHGTRSAPTGEFTVVKVGNYEMKLPRSGKKARKSGKNLLDARILLARFADVAEQAARAGRAVEYKVRVTPTGVVEPISEADGLADALAAARKRGQEKVSEILKGDEMLNARDFGELIGASHETVNVRRQRGEILGLQAATRSVRYPSWQVTERGTVVPGLSLLFQALGGQPWTVYRFLRTSHSEFGGRTALEVLKAGRQEDVLNVARNQATGAFS